MNLNQFYHYYKSKSGGGVPNFLKATEDFDSSIDWNKLPSTDAPTVSGGITDPNGGSDAQRINFTDNRQARVQQRVSLSASTQYTFSVYARVNTGTEQFRLRNVTLAEAEAKTATTSWTRFSYTFTTTTGGNYDLSIQNTSNDAKTIEFWGAMLNVGASANAYVKVDPSISGSTPTPAYSGFGDTYGDVTAYYSLRKFTEAETLNAIRVRRSSDDTEQDIGFDANGDLDTTALLAFVNEDVIVQNPDFSISDGNYTGINGTRTINQSVGGQTGVLSFTLSGGNTDHYLRNLSKPRDRVEINFDFYIPSTNAVVDAIYVRDGSGGVAGTVSGTDAWTNSGDLILDTTSIQLRLVAALSSNPTASVDADGDIIYIDNLVITQTTADGAVTTFYDQSGNGNNATNATSTEQPLIVSAGILAQLNSKAAINGDGADDVLSLSTGVDLSSGYSIFKVVQVPSGNTYGITLSNSAGNDRNLIFDANYRFQLDGTNNNNNGASGNRGAQYLWSLVNDTSGNLDMNRNGSAYGSQLTGLTGTFTFENIGTNVAFNSFEYFQELIVFNSDQSGNLTGIESNINDHFSIYT